MASLKKRLERVANGEGGSPMGFLKDQMPEQLLVVPVESIERDPNQPRTDLGDLDDLKASIRSLGVLQPIVVTPIEGERYLILTGERRFTAAKAVGLTSLSCIVRTIDEQNRVEAQLVENTHRKDLNPVEEATTYKRLMDEFGLSQRQLAERLGKSLGGINQTLRILSLPPQILEGAQTSERLSKSVLLEIAKRETESEQLAFYEHAKSGNLTVQAARQAKGKPADGGVAPAPRSRVSIPTKTASVTLLFARADVSPQDVVEALSEALRHARRQAKVEAEDRGLSENEPSEGDATAS